MKTLTYKLLAFLLLFIFIDAPAFAETIVINDVGVAIKQAKETDTKVLLVYIADWCKYCEYLKRDLIKNMDEINEEYTVCFVDFDTNRELARKHGVSSIPVSVILNDNIKTTGYGGDFNSYKRFLGLWSIN